jgi:hypothetical protein
MPVFLLVIPLNKSEGCWRRRNGGESRWYSSASSGVCMLINTRLRLAASGGFHYGSLIQI